MIKDITLGQYFPGNSVVHRMDPRYKIIISGLFIVMLFIGDSAVCLEVGAVFTAMALILSQIPVKMILRSLKPIIPIILFTSFFNLFLITGGIPLFEWKFIKITDTAVHTTVFMIVRVILLISGTSLLTYTTSPIALTDAIERLLGPLKKIRVPVHDLAMMMTIALRFIPTLIEETDKIISAQKARGVDFEGGKLMDKVKSVIPIIIPLFVSAVRRAGELATAMECRCYQGDRGRTKMCQLKSSAADYIALIITMMFLAAVIFINIVN
ncbi:energy-coupling factor transporter transmembrane component T family protein [Porcipelethomonas sp.]|uniref:energy-coupling factor transporter transmembrane component T family protein n=1 Tax=Porcipelethomonas sp. TaxID=2981675 RepID=UPI003EF8A8F0